MSTRGFDDEMLMAFADGEIGAEAGAAVARAMAADPAIAARVALFLQTRVALSEAAQIEAPVPEALVARVHSTLAAARSMTPTQSHKLGRVTGGMRAAGVRRLSSSWPIALAASVALVAGLSAGLLFAGRSALAPGLAASAADPALWAVLDALPTGARQTLPDGREIAIITSFRDGEGGLCREIEQRGADGSMVIAVACRQNDGWVPRLTIAASSVEGTYAPASSLGTIDAYLEAVEAGPPLGPEEETEALLSASSL